MRSTINWQYVAQAGPPSDNRTLHIAVMGDEGPEIGMGWWDGDVWRDCVDANDLGTTVYAYAELAAVPPVRPMAVAA